MPKAITHPTKDGAVKGAQLSWWCVKRLFIWKMKESAEFSIEERLVIIGARTWKEAFLNVRKEEVQYCKNDKTANFKISLLTAGWSAYLMDPIPVRNYKGESIEVYSLLHKNVRSKRIFIRAHL
jgi:hypothetical protein